jgi:signal transduction histidine kinase
MVTGGDLLDLRTILVSVTIMQIFLSLMMILYWKYRSVYPGFGIWSVHLLFIAGGNIGMFLRGIIPDTIAILITNLSTTIGILLLYEATKRFYTAEPIQRVWYLILVPLFGGILYWHFVYDSFSLRTVLISVTLIVILIPIIRSFYINTLPMGKFISQILGSTYLLLIVVLAFRAIDLLINPVGKNLFEGNSLNSVLYIYMLFATIISTFVFILLNFERKAYELDCSHAKVAKLATRYDLAIKAAGAGVWEMDVKTHRLIVDDQIYLLAGQDPKSKNPDTSFDAQEIIHREDISRIFEQVDQVTREDEEVIAEYRIVLPNGEVRHHLSHAKSILNEDGTLRLVGLATDITTLRRAQNALSNALKKLSIMTSVTRHDILNASTVISMYSEFMLQQTTDPDLKTRLSAISESVKTIIGLIRFTGIYQQLGVKEPIWADIVTILTCERISLLVGQRSFTIPQKGIFIYTDQMIESVIYNLIENSIRHGGQVRNIAFSYQFDGDTLLIIYSDDGNGIPHEDKTKIFDQGFGKNTGMGLFLCREILGITGLIITENGEPGVGARFEILVAPGLYRDERLQKDSSY